MHTKDIYAVDDIQQKMARRDEIRESDQSPPSQPAHTQPARHPSTPTAVSNRTMTPLEHADWLTK